MSLRRALPLRSLLLPFALAAVTTGCGRSAGGSGGGEKATEALSAAQQARATATTASEAVEGLDGRVTTLEGEVADHETRLGAAEAAVEVVVNTQTSLNDRVVTLEQGGAGGIASAVAVDDPAAAGFVQADAVTNVEEGFASLNGKLAAQTTRIDTLEDDFSTDLAGTVVQVVNDEIANGNINATVDVSFTPPAVDVDPRADGADAFPEYSASATLAEAITALRYANQIKVTAPATDTRLGDLADGTVRSYVQEAILVLDKDLYDLLAGNLSPELDTTNLPDDGSYATVQLAVEDLYARVSAVQAGTDPTLLTFVEEQVAAGVADGQPYILGPTAVATTGHLVDDDTTPTLHGLRGASARCLVDYPAEPTAHLCSVEEAQRALSQGRYAGALADVTTWTSAPTLATSCDGMLSEDAGANGTTLVVDLDYTSGAVTAPVIHTDTSTCDQTFPILCCR